jgi:hypothetical protein
VRDKWRKFAARFGVEGTKKRPERPELKIVSIRDGNANAQFMVFGFNIPNSDPDRAPRDTKLSKV